MLELLIVLMVCFLSGFSFGYLFYKYLNVFKKDGKKIPFRKGLL